MVSKNVGRFTIEDRVLSGPRDYIEEQGNLLLDKILAGGDTMFNVTAHHQGDLGQSPDVETAILVRLQTDFAGWLGIKQAAGWLASSKAQ